MNFLIQNSGFVVTLLTEFFLSRVCCQKRQLFCTYRKKCRFGKNGTKMVLGEYFIVDRAELNPGILSVSLNETLICELEIWNEIWIEIDFETWI